jgi:hypothetical protein
MGTSLTASASQKLVLQARRGERKHKLCQTALHRQRFNQCKSQQKKHIARGSNVLSYLIQLDMIK